MINEFRFGYSRLRTAFDSAIAISKEFRRNSEFQGIPDAPGNGGLPTLNHHVDLLRWGRTGLPARTAARATRFSFQKI